MKKISFVALISILSLGLNSCSYISSFSEKRRQVPPVAGKPITVKAEGKAKSADADAKKDSLAKAIEDADEVKREQAIFGLASPTNPEARVRGSIRGRRDPFSTLAVKARLESKATKKSPNDSRNNVADDRGSNPRNQRNQNSRRNIRPSEDNLASTPTIDTLDKLSPTELADNVLVTGLVELGDRVRLIVQAPGEVTSRYVDLGQYISNGKVLVKRVESNFPTPRVVLEQAGVEVVKIVGETNENSTLGGDEQASLPAPPPSSGNSISWLSNYLSDKSE